MTDFLEQVVLRTDSARETCALRRNRASLSLRAQAFTRTRKIARVHAVRSSFSSGAFETFIPASAESGSFAVSENETLNSCSLSITVPYENNQTLLSIRHTPDADSTAFVSAPVTGEAPGNFLVAKGFFAELVLVVNGFYCGIYRELVTVFPVRTADLLSKSGRQICVTNQLFRF